MDLVIALGADALASLMLIMFMGVLAVLTVLSWWSKGVRYHLKKLRKDRYVSTAIVFAILAAAFILFAISQFMRGENDEGAIRLIIAGVFATSSTTLFIISSVQWWETRRERRSRMQQVRKEAKRPPLAQIPPDDNEEFLKSLPKGPN